MGRLLERQKVGSNRLITVGAQWKFNLTFFLRVFRDFDYWPLNGGWPLNKWPLNVGSTVYRVG